MSFTCTLNLRSKQEYSKFAEQRHEIDEASKLVDVFAQNIPIFFVFAAFFLHWETDASIFLRFLNHWRNYFNKSFFNFALGFEFSFFFQFCVYFSCHVSFKLLLMSQVSSIILSISSDIVLVTSRLKSHLVCHTARIEFRALHFKTTVMMCTSHSLQSKTK